VKKHAALQGPDCNETPKDKTYAQRFEFSAEGTNINSKMPHQMSLFIKQYKYTSTS
jgi:hypothetical protein